MKRLITILVAAFALLPAVSAQETVTGIVVDKNGNPLPGVKIEVPGTPDQTISDLDGSFSIPISNPKKRKLLASYAGMNSQKAKLKDGITIKMAESNWWTQKPDKWNWFVEAMVAIPTSPSFNTGSPAYGLMFGYVKNIGFYVKGVANDIWTNGDTYNNYSFFTNQKLVYWSATAGAMVRLGCPIYFYAGTGYSQYRELYKKHSDGLWYQADEFTSVVIDLGFLLRIKKVTLSLGTDLVPTGLHLVGNFGIGYSF